MAEALFTNLCSNLRYYKKKSKKDYEHPLDKRNLTCSAKPRGDPLCEWKVRDMSVNSMYLCLDCVSV